MLAVDSVREGQRRIWDGVCPGWERWQRTFENGARHVTERLLVLGGVAPGQSVLDLGCGVGEPALSAARAVGESGRVVGVDLSPRMIGAARRAAAAMSNAEFVVGDFEGALLLGDCFDVALSRWALPFAPDRVAALRAAAAQLERNGVLAVAVWGAPQDVPVISLAFRVISEYLRLAPAPGAGPFALADPGVLQRELEEAGFEGVEVETVVAPFAFASVNELASFSRDVLPPWLRDQLSERCGSVEDEGVWSAFADAAARYEQADGSVLLPSLVNCARAVTGGSHAL